MAVTAVAPGLSPLGLSCSTAEISQSTSRKSQRPGRGPVLPRTPCSRDLCDVTSCRGLRKEGVLDRLSEPATGYPSLAAAVAAAISSRRTGGSRRGVVVAIFEKFTERAIKAVMNSQKEAKALGKKEVTYNVLCQVS